MREYTWNGSLGPFGALVIPDIVRWAGQFYVLKWCVWLVE
jgi:hypothetical protein